MNLLNYIRGHRKGKEANRLEKESMKDPLLADALEGYSQVKGDHEKHIKELQQKVNARSHRRKNAYAITWSVAACLVIGIGISSYFLFLKGDSSNHEILLAKEQAAPNKNDNIQYDQSSTYADSKERADSNQIAQNRTLNQKKESQETASSSHMKYKAPIISKDENIADVSSVDELRSQEELSQEKVAAEPELRISSTNKSAMSANAMPVGKDIMDMKIVDIDSLSEKSTTLLPISEPLIGMDEYNKYLKKNMTRSQSDECKEVYGRIILIFQVDKDGRPYDITVNRGLCPALDKEAIRLVKEGPGWSYNSRGFGQVTVEFDDYPQK